MGTHGSLHLNEFELNQKLSSSVTLAPFQVVRSHLWQVAATTLERQM